MSSRRNHDRHTVTWWKTEHRQQRKFGLQLFRTAITNIQTGASIPIYQWRQMRHGHFFLGGGE